MDMTDILRHAHFEEIVLLVIFGPPVSPFLEEVNLKVAFTDNWCCQTGVSPTTGVAADGSHRQLVLQEGGFTDNWC